MQILFVTYTNIGDVVMSSVLLNRILADYPDAQVDIVVGGRAGELFEGLPNLRRLIPLKKRKHHMHYVDLARKLGTVKYDLIVDLRTPFLKYFLNGAKSITFPKKKGRKVELLGALWPSCQSLAQKVWIQPRVHEVVKEHLKLHNPNHAPLIGLGPTANWMGKQWGQKNFARVVEKMLALETFKHAKFVVMGAPNEVKLVEDLAQAIPQENCIDLVGKTSISESYAWIAACDLFIGHDSGLAHMAAAADVPTVTIFGPMDDTKYAPLAHVGEVVLPPMRTRKDVNLTKKHLPRLITDISVDDVCAAIGRVWQAGQEFKLNEDV